MHFFCRDPNKPAAVPLVWPKFDNHSEYHLTLNTKLSIQNKMLATRTAFWTELALKELKDVHNFHTHAINSITPKMHGVNQRS